MAAGWSDWDWETAAAAAAVVVVVVVAEGRQCSGPSAGRVNYATGWT